MPINLNRAPYYDDFLENKNYLKLLFQPGRAVQARELTVIQSTLQNQIAKIGDHLFDDGAKILGGQIDFDGASKTLPFIKVKDFDVYGRNVPFGVIRGRMRIRRQNDDPSNPQVLAVVQSAKTRTSPTGDNVIYIKYIFGEDIGFKANEPLVIFDPEVGDKPVLTATSIDVSDSSFTGYASRVIVAGGLYYYKGQFLTASSESVMLNDKATSSNLKIGYTVRESITSSRNDLSLNEPSTNNNRGAPGADRLSYQLSLVTVQDSVETLPDNFFQIARVLDGRLVWTAKNTVYGDVKEMLAKRTFEESGDYVAKKYIATVENTTSLYEPTVQAKIADGIAYVKGYRHDATGSNPVKIDKGRTTRTLSRSFDNDFGDNFVIVQDYRFYTNSGKVTGDSGFSQDFNTANGIFHVGTLANDNGSVIANSIVGQEVSFFTHLSAKMSGKSNPFGGNVKTQNAYTAFEIGTAKITHFILDTLGSSYGAQESLFDPTGYRAYFSDFKATEHSGKFTTANYVIAANAVALNDGTLAIKFDSDPNSGWIGNAASHDAERNIAFHSGSPTHLSDRIVLASSNSSWNNDRRLMSVNSTMMVVSQEPRSSTHHSPGDTVEGPFNVYRTTGNLAYTQAVTLDINKSPSLNGGFVGGQIQILNSTGGVVETHAIKAFHGTGISQNTFIASSDDFGATKSPEASRRATALLNTDISSQITKGQSYRITMSPKDAISIGTTLNKDTKGVPFFDNVTEAPLHPAFGIHFGVYGTNDQLVSSTLSDGIVREDNGVEVGNRSVQGHMNFNPNGVDENFLMLLKPENEPIVPRRVASHGALDTGFTSNTEVFFTGHSRTLCGSSGTTLLFNLPSSEFFNSGTSDATKSHAIPYPYNLTVDGLYSGSASDLISAGAESELNENVTLVEYDSTGQIIARLESLSYAKVDGIQKVEMVPGATPQIRITLAGSGSYDISSFTNGNTYELLYPYKAVEVKPAYKALVKANLTHVELGGAGVDDATQLGNGHIFVANTLYASMPTKVELNIPDVFKVHKVLEGYTPVSTDKISQSGLTDVTNCYTLDTGQADSFYGHAKLLLRGSAFKTPTANLMIFVDFFQKTAAAPDAASRPISTNASFFAADSYQTTTDLTLSSPATINFEAGDFVQATTATVDDDGNSTIAAGYISDVANTSGLAKVSVVGATGKFGVGTIIETAGSSTVTKIGTISKVVEADLTFEEIPKYTNARGVQFPLRNFADFRSYRSNASPRLDGYFAPIPTANGIGFGRASDMTSVQTSHKIEYYLPRVDTIAVDTNGEYFVSAGTPSTKPLPNVERLSDNQMALFNVHIPAYTFDTTNVRLEDKTVVRQTMKDLSRLAQRVKNLEYYVSLNALERRTADTLIADSDGNTRFQNGIFVDNFETLSFADLESEGVRNSTTDTFTFQIGDSQLKPSYGTVEEFDGLDWKATNDSNMKFYGRIADKPTIGMLDFEEVVHDQQPSATSQESLNPFDNKNYIGRLQIFPETDHWFDLTDVSFAISSDDGVLDSLRVDSSVVGSNFNKLSALSDFGALIQGGADADFGRSSETWRGTESLEDLSRQVALSVTGSSLNIDQALDRVKTGSEDSEGTRDSVGAISSGLIIPQIRERDIIIDARGLKPKSRADLKFDGVYAEHHFMPASRAMMWQGGRDTVPDDQTNQLQFTPEQIGNTHTYETVQVYNTVNSLKANATLITVRDWQHGGTTGDGSLSNAREMYIVPEINQRTGKIDFDTLTDGYYNSTWSDANIKSYGWFGNAQRYIKGLSSGAVGRLISSSTHTYTGGIHEGTVITGLYNGHYSGQATGGSTTTIQLSTEAHKYVNANFGTFHTSIASSDYDASIFTDLPNLAKITIVDGAGAGQEAIVNNYNETTRTATFRSDSTLDTALDATSIYALSMEPTNINRNPELRQVGNHFHRTNKYGDKIGILHIPKNSKTSFSYGRKLIELSDRNDGANYLATTYAAGYYNVRGFKTYDSSGYRSSLKELVDPTSAYETTREGLEDYNYVNARTGSGNVSDGKTGVVKGVVVNNGGTTTTYAPGDARYGTINESDVFDQGE